MKTTRKSLQHRFALLLKVHCIQRTCNDPRSKLHQTETIEKLSQIFLSNLLCGKDFNFPRIGLTISSCVWINSAAPSLAFSKIDKIFPRCNNLRGKKDLRFLENTFILFCIVRIHTLANLPSSIFPPYKHLGKCLCDSVCRLCVVPWTASNLKRS